MIVEKCYRAHVFPTATKPELYQLLLRAETDHTWRFWYDLYLAHKDYLPPVLIGNVTGCALIAGVIGGGARLLQSKIPNISLPMACIGFAVTSRCFGRFGAICCGMLTGCWLIPRAPQIGPQ